MVLTHAQFTTRRGMAGRFLVRTQRFSAHKSLGRHRSSGDVYVVEVWPWFDSCSCVKFVVGPAIPLDVQCIQSSPTSLGKWAPMNRPTPILHNLREHLQKDSCPTYTMPHCAGPSRLCRMKKAIGNKKRTAVMISSWISGRTPVGE